MAALMTSPRAWSFLTVEGARQYGGNAGYADKPSAMYRYDSDVANHRSVRSGDVAVIRSRVAVLGIATIENVVEGTGPKARQRCPTCSAVNIKARTTQSPRWRCTSGHLFDEPVEDVVQVTTFEAHYGATFTQCPSDITLDVLNGAVMRPNDQMSIKEIDLARLEAFLLSSPAATAIVRNHVRRLSIVATGGTDRQRSGSIIEERRRVLKEIALRRGQVRFRKRLIRRYGASCQVSGCAFPGLLEAAHVNPYALSNDNSEENGLLLRSDLHTLFDLGLLGIDPRSMKITVHPQARLAGYEQFDGATLLLNGTSGPDPQALEERWTFYQGQLISGGSTD